MNATAGTSGTSPAVNLFMTSCGITASSNTASASGIIVASQFNYVGTVNCTFSITNPISTTADCARVIEAAVLDSGTSTATTTTTLTDSTKTWTVNAYAGFIVRLTRSGVQQFKTIFSNTATQLTFTTTWSPSITATEPYQIVPTLIWGYANAVFLTVATGINNSYTSGITASAFTTTPTSGGSA